MSRKTFQRSWNVLPPALKRDGIFTASRPLFQPLPSEQLNLRLASRNDRTKTKADSLQNPRLTPRPRHRDPQRHYGRCKKGAGAVALLQLGRSVACILMHPTLTRCDGDDLNVGCIVLPLVSLDLPKGPSIYYVRKIFEFF